MSNLFDCQLLKSLVTSKEIFNKYGDTLSFKDIHLSNIHEQIKLYYLHHDVEEIELEELDTICNQIYKDTLYTKLLGEIYATEINERYVSTLVTSLLNRYIIHSIHEITNEKLATQSFETIEDIIELTNRQEEDSEVEISSLSLKEILSEKEGYSWPWEKFNQYLGPLPSATHGLVFGRVEIGKTALITNISLGLLQQNATIVHFNNEDPIGKLMERYYMINFGVSKEVIFKNLEKASDSFEEKYGENLFIYDTAGLSLTKIQQLVHKHKADVVLIDQLDPMSNEIDPSSLENLYKGIRNIAKSEETRIISVTQASHGENDWLGMGDVHNSKVGKQAALDYMIGMGGNPYVPLRRYMTLPKNKLTGRHESFILEFEPETMRIK